MSIGARRRAVCIINRQATISVVTNLGTIRVQFVEHQPRIAYALIIFVGSGFTIVSFHQTVEKGPSATSLP